MSKTESITYFDGNTELEGFCAYPDQPGNHPAVIVAHDWSGKNDFACEKAKALAELGYIGFALDMYGKGKLGHTNEEKSALMQPLIQNRSALQQRILSAYQTVAALPQVDKERIGAIGFCFGGLCVLDLARSDANVTGVVSFHGLLHAPEHHKIKPIKAKILALHGYADPMVTMDHVLAFGKEMSDAKADWELNMYGKAMHAFTNPLANDPSFGTIYDKPTAERAWIAMKDFFVEVFQR